MLERLKSLPLTLFLSILIWMYAEAQFTDTGTVEGVMLRPYSEIQSYVVRVHNADPNVIRPTGSMTLNLTLQGPRNQIEAVREELTPPRDTQTVAQMPLTFALSAAEISEAIKGNHEIERRTVDILNQHSYFRSKGVTVTAASPATLRFEVDELKTIQRPAVFRSTIPVDRSVLDPSEVDVLIPAQVLETLGEEQFTIRALPLDEAQLAAAAPETEKQVQVRYEVIYPGPRDERIRVSTPGGSATVRVQRRTPVLLNIADLPIWVSGPPAMLTRFDVDVQPRTVSISLTGPQAIVSTYQRRLEGGSTPKDIGIFAYLDLTPDDRPGPQSLQRTVRYVVPEGLTINRSPIEATFRLIEKSPATAPGGG